MVFSFVAIQTKSEQALADSQEFYARVAGMRVTRDFTAGPSHIVMMQGEGCSLELICGPEGPTVTAGEHPVLGFDVDDLDQEIRNLGAAGVPIEEGPVSPNPGVRFVMIRDPNGIRIELLEHRQ